MSAAIRSRAGQSYHILCLIARHFANIVYFAGKIIFMHSPAAMLPLLFPQRPPYFPAVLRRGSSAQNTAAYACCFRIKQKNPQQRARHGFADTGSTGPLRSENGLRRLPVKSPISVRKANKAGNTEALKIKNSGAAVLKRGSHRRPYHFSD